MSAADRRTREIQRTPLNQKQAITRTMAIVIVIVVTCYGLERGQVEGHLHRYLDLISHLFQF